MPIMRLLLTCMTELKVHLRGPIVSERSLCFVKYATDHKAIIYFAFPFTRLLKGAVDMIKGNCTVRKVW